MELKIGMYVRFDNVICQIEEVEEDWLCFDIGFYDHWNELTYSMKYKEFVEEYKPKFSDNIIDLIEVGDYVNGYKITSIQEIEEPYYPKRLLYFEEPQDYVLACFNNEDIKSIVTKEQFESMQYKVEE